MSEEQARTLGNEDIHVQYRNRQDMVRQAIGSAKTFAAQPVSDDGTISLPLNEFRNIVAAYRMVYKTVGETIHQSFANQPAGYVGRDVQDRGIERAPIEATGAEAAVRFAGGQAKAAEAMEEVLRVSDFNEDPFRRGDQIAIPATALESISSALIERNELMTDLLNQPVLLAELVTKAAESGGTRPPDHGDYGASWDPINTGDWTRD